MATDKFSFWIGYRDALRKLEPSDGYRLVMAMCDYAFDGIEPDFTDEDQLLTRYGNSAEAVVLNITRRTFEELKEMNPTGEDAIPDDIWEASVMLVAASYEQRSAISMQQLYAIPYGFDAKVKPYIRLTTKEED